MIIFLFFGFILSDEPESKFEFNTDVSRLMKILINSLYSNKEIFLRELISNAADALNKVKYENQTNPEIMLEGEFSKMDITIIPDEDSGTLAIVDRGIGMNREELITNLGTVAQSGTLKFLLASENNASAQDLIGQFGVGFYSCFLVAKKVVVQSKRYNEKQYIWTSEGSNGFTVEEDKSGENLGRGTKVTLYMNDEVQYLQYSNTTRIRDIANKYSQFIDFPIYLRVEQEDKYKSHSNRRHDDDDDDDDEGDDTLEELEYVAPTYRHEHINLNKAIWLRDPDDENENLMDKDYIDFFKEIAGEFKEDPINFIHFHQVFYFFFVVLISIHKKKDHRC
jgi:heat shock protein beta